MPVEIKTETLDSLFEYYNDADFELIWPSIFTLPIWLKTWWETLGEQGELFIRSVWQDQRMIGIAPLVIAAQKNTAFLAGSPDVCDYLDFIVAPQKERQFFQALFPALREQGLKRLELSSQRPDAAFFRGLFDPEDCHDCGCRVHVVQENESYELALLSTWEEYLLSINKKQRHEVRRKLRRLEKEVNTYRYRVLADNGAVKDFIPQFFDLFKQDPAKAAFLTAGRENFFRSIITTAARQGLARFGLLEIDDAVSAAVLYFDYRARIYLYNSGYNPGYRALSVGLLSKVFCIEESIERSRQTFDFLKGSEVYKSRLGGTPVPIYSVIVEISES